VSIIDALLESLHTDAPVHQVLVGAFWTEKTLPRIACVGRKRDDQDLSDGLAIRAVGLGDQLEGVDVPVLDPDEVSKIADLVEQEAFKLPNLGCGS
jgi:hypothetical protein